MRLTNEQREQVITLRRRHSLKEVAELRPRNREEARATLRYLMGSERDEAPEAERILDNLIG